MPDLEEVPDAGGHLRKGGVSEQRRSAGGARRGSGRRKQPKPYVRSEPVRVLFRPEEWHAIDILARTWDVPVATAVWALTVDALEDRTGERARKLIQVSRRDGK